MTREEEMALRELAANPHYISKVSALLGPLSLWSRDGLEREIAKAVEAEREACAQLCEQTNDGTPYNLADACAEAIRARGQA
jgi:hypothetical protein